MVTTLGELDQRVAGACGWACRLKGCTAPGGRGLTPRSADLRAETRAKFEHCMELPPLSGRQQPTEADAEVLRLRKEIDDAHKARRVRCLRRWWVLV